MWTISQKWRNKNVENKHGLGHVTLKKFGTPWIISPKRVKVQTWNLACTCIWTISPKWTNKISEKGRGLGHVTLIKFGTPSNISPKRVMLQTSNLVYRCMWTISQKWRNKNVENVTLKNVENVILKKFGTPWIISPKRVKVQTWNLACRCIWTISPKWTNEISAKGRGLGHVTLIICSILWDVSKQENLANTKVMHDSSAYMKAPMDGTNLRSTGNPTVKTVTAIPRYVIKPLTYLFHCLTSAWIFILLQRCHDDIPGAGVLITGLRHHLALWLAEMSLLAT